MEALPQQKDSKSAKNVAMQYLMVLAGAGVLYAFTCAPAVLWQDSGLFVYRIWHNDLEGNLGLALAHPLYIMLGIVAKYIPFGDMAYRINLLSAVCGAIAIANLFLLLRLWLDRTLPAVIGAVTLAVSWTFWQHAVIAEAYSLYAAQMFGELIVLLQYVRTKRVGYLYLLGLFNGLAIANHLWGSFGFVCYTVFLIAILARREIHLKHFVITVCLWIIGAMPYEYLVIKNIILSGDIQGTLSSAAFGNGWQGTVLNANISSKIIMENVIFILLNFPTPNFILFFTGLYFLRHSARSRSFGIILLMLTVLHFVFAFRYTVPDRYAFFLPFYCFAAIFIGLGADVFFRRYSHKVLIAAVFILALLPIATYSVTPEFARRYYKPLGQRRQRPYRDEYKYFLQPWKTGYRGAERFAKEALDIVEENAVIYAYTTDVHALLYLQEVRGKRTDVRITSGHDNSKHAPIFNSDTVADLMDNSSLYVSTTFKGYCPDFLLENHDFINKGILYKVVEKDMQERKVK
jgi:hypothetical protein